MPLRPYQQTALAAIKARYDAGVNKQLLVLPTGSGKTEVFAHLPGTLGLAAGEQMVVLVHRKLLVAQAAERIARYNPTLTVGIERAEYTNTDADIVVASLQTVSRIDSKDPNGFSERLRKFSQDRCKYLIIDEIHHGVSDSYGIVLKYFGLYKPEPEFNRSKSLLLGVTATPRRGDNIGLELILDEIVFSKDLREMIQEGWLVEPAGYRVETQVDLDSVKVSHGDFQTASLELTVNTPERNKLIVDKYRELGLGRPAVVFAVDVSHSHALASEFRRSGVGAMPLSGNTPDEERERIFSMYRDGSISVICSCQVMSEGIDIVEATVGILARPTKSSLLFTQQIGRLLRPNPSPESGLPRIKDKAIIIDLVDNSARHRLQSLPSLFGLRPDFDLKGTGAVRALEEIEETQAQYKQLHLGDVRDLQSLRSLVERIDLFKPPSIPDIARQHSRFAWIEGASMAYQLAIPDGGVLSIRENALGLFSVSELKNGLRIPIHDNVDNIATAFRIADSRVPQDARRLLSAAANWRSEAPTSKQILALAKLDRDMFARFGRDMSKFETFIRCSFTRGQVSSLISERTASLTTRALT